MHIWRLCNKFVNKCFYNTLLVIDLIHTCLHNPLLIPYMTRFQPMVPLPSQETTIHSLPSFLCYLPATSQNIRTEIKVRPAKTCLRLNLEVVVPTFSFAKKQPKFTQSWFYTKRLFSAACSLKRTVLPQVNN